MKKIGSSLFSNDKGNSKLKDKNLNYFNQQNSPEAKPKRKLSFTKLQEYNNGLLKILPSTTKANLDYWNAIEKNRREGLKKIFKLPSVNDSLISTSAYKFNKTQHVETPLSSNGSNSLITIGYTNKGKNSVASDQE